MDYFKVTDFRTKTSIIEEERKRLFQKEKPADTGRPVELTIPTQSKKGERGLAVYYDEFTERGKQRQENKVLQKEQKEAEFNRIEDEKERIKNEKELSYKKYGISAAMKKVAEKAVQEIVRETVKEVWQKEVWQEVQKVEEVSEGSYDYTGKFVTSQMEMFRQYGIVCIYCKNPMTCFALIIEGAKPEQTVMEIRSGFGYPQVKAASQIRWKIGAEVIPLCDECREKAPADIICLEAAQVSGKALPYLAKDRTADKKEHNNPTIVEAGQRSIRIEE